MKRLVKLLGLGLFALVLAACGQGSQGGPDGQKEVPQGLEAHSYTYYDAFDTIIDMTLYTETEEEADQYAAYAHSRFQDLHQVFTSFEDYDGVINVKTVNDRAGQGPVEADPLLFFLIEDSLAWQDEISSKVNIAIGPLTSLWHDYREGHIRGLDADAEEGLSDKDPSLPPPELLEEAASHMDTGNIILDPQAKTVELKDPAMKLDLGAIAKGYATEVIAQELEEKGLESALISAGGNVRLIGQPGDGRDKFVVGIQNPLSVTDPEGGHSNILAALEVRDMSVVTSGDYQRYYVVDGQLYHHIIDPDTLYPGDHFRSTTVVAQDSGLCDFLSTTIFLLPLEEGYDLIQGLDGVEAFWLDKDGQATMTPGLEDMLKGQDAND